MLCKIALGNVRRAGRDYLVYLFTLTLAVTVFYAFNTVTVQVDLAGVAEKNSGMGELLGSIISGLTVFLAFVMGFLMVYANNFIMKRRKKEFGLYQVLGMSRGQVARIMTIETLAVSVVALVLGVLLGLGLSQLMVFFTASLFKTQIADFHFFFSLSAFMITVGCLVAIFLVTLVFNLRVVRRAKIIDLMSAERKNEAIKTRNPWLSAVICVVGLVGIIVAYVRLLNDGLPYDGAPEGINAFLITTVMVVVATILFFFGLSGFLLKVLQSMRGLYWRGLNMVTLRQLAAKVNTVSFSMAVIAMVLFLAITSVTAGMSLASVMNSTVERGTPVDYTRVLVYFSPQVIDEMNAEPGLDGTYDYATEPVDILEASAQADTVEDTDEGVTEVQPFDLASIAGDHVQVDTYDSTPVGETMPVVNLQKLVDITGMPFPKGVESADVASLGLAVVTESNYNEYLRFRGMDTIDLGENGYTVTCDLGSSVLDIYNKLLSNGSELTIGGRTLHPVQDHVNEDASVFMNAMMGMNSGTIVLPDDLVASLNLPMYTSYLLTNYANGISVEEGDAYVSRYRTYGDIVSDETGHIIASWGQEATRTDTYASTDTMNGLISYLAIYIGFVLVVACAAILTIQQLSGVADATKSYRILGELGTSQIEIAHSLLAQQTIFFVFPLAVGVAHSICALKVIVELITLFGGLTIGGMVGLTGVIFLVAYGGYFFLTYLMSKSIVRSAAARQ